MHQDKVNLVKVYKTEEEEQAKVRHILISSKEGDANDAENKKLADSILYAVEEILVNLPSWFKNILKIRALLLMVEYILGFLKGKWFLNLKTLALIKESDLVVW